MVVRKIAPVSATAAGLALVAAGATAVPQELQKSSSASSSAAHALQPTAAAEPHLRQNRAFGLLSVPHCVQFTWSSPRPTVGSQWSTTSSSRIVLGVDQRDDDHAAMRATLLADRPLFQGEFLHGKIRDIRRRKGSANTDCGCADQAISLVQRVASSREVATPTSGEYSFGNP